MISENGNNSQNLKSNEEQKKDDLQKGALMTKFVQAVNNTKKEVIKDYNKTMNTFKTVLKEDHLNRVNGLQDTINNLANVTGKEFKRMKMIQQSMQKCIELQNLEMENCRNIVREFDKNCGIIQNLINETEKKVGKKRSSSLDLEMGKENEKKPRNN